MKAVEVTAEYDRRLDEIHAQFDLDVEAFKAARKRKDAAVRELDAWFDKVYDGLKEVKL